MVNWPWSRRRPEAVGGREARERSEQALEGAKKRAEEARQVVESMSRLREDNHFSSKIEHMIRTGRAE